MFKNIQKSLLSCHNLISVTSIRTVKWHPYYKKPIITSEELENIKKFDEEKYKELKYNPIKSLKSNKYNSVFYDPFLNHLVGKITRKGCRERADKLVKETLFLIKKKRMELARSIEPEKRDDFVINPIEILKKAFENLKPEMKVVTVKRGGAKYFTPVTVLDREKDKIVYKWVREVIEDRPRPRVKKFPQVFSEELLLAYKNEGKLYKKKIDLYQACEANKAYVNYIYLKK